MIADSVSCNIRELEGCLARLSALASLTGRPLDLAFAEESLKDIVQPRASTCTVAAVQRAVARHFGVTEEALRGKRRTSTVALARQVAMYLSKQVEGLSYVEVGRRFGSRDHSTVLFAVRKIERLLESDPAVAEAVGAIRATLD
jgi:chromosomal replication initiator protein